MSEANPSSEQVPDVASVAYSRLLTPAPTAASLTLTRDGHLLVNVRGETMTRTDGLLLASENLAVRPLNRRMQGRAVPDVFRRLASLAGEGYLVLSREGENFHPMMLRRDLCFFVEPFLWAMDASLMWDVGMLPGSRGGLEIQLVRVAGEGLVAIRVPGELVAVKVSPERPHRIRVDAFVGWVGSVVPSMERDVPFLLCEGEGAVFVSLPQSERESWLETQVRAQRSEDGASEAERAMANARRRSVSQVNIAAQRGRAG